MVEISIENWLVQCDNENATVLTNLILPAGNMVHPLYKPCNTDLNEIN